MLIKSEIPKDLGIIAHEPSEVMYYLYYPIKNSDDWKLSIPSNLEWIYPFLNKVHAWFEDSGTFIEYIDKYLYLTCKNFYVEPMSYGNRPGWHGDGFGTDDINFIWCNSSPTEFAIQEFNVSDDDTESLKQFNEQVKEESVYTALPYHLYMITPDNVHRVALNKEGGMRTFLKISLSKHAYNLKGNSVNPSLSADWQFYDRDQLRNMECKGSNGDSLGI